MQNAENTQGIEAFMKKHKVAILVGVAVAALMTFMDRGSDQMVADGGGYQAPVYDSGGSGAGGDGTVDMEQWREEQRRDDRMQRDRIDSIREVERCYDPETGTTYEVSIHTGC